MVIYRYIVASLIHTVHTYIHIYIHTYIHTIIKIMAAIVGGLLRIRLIVSTECSTSYAFQYYRVSDELRTKELRY